MAYIDSKLAEARSSIASGNDVENRPSHLTNVQESSTTQPTPKLAPPATGTGQSTEERTYQDAIARSYKTYQRPIKRRPKPREEADIARDSMIDQIMQESSVPMYDYSTSSNTVTGEDEVDNDAATAEAFKAQLLVEMEMHNRRRLAPKVKDANAPTGPKLGGSRSQRERMKALEEAKGPGAKK